MESKIIDDTPHCCHHGDQPIDGCLLSGSIALS